MVRRPHTTACWCCHWCWQTPPEARKGTYPVPARMARRKRGGESGRHSQSVTAKFQLRSCTALFI